MGVSLLFSTLSMGLQITVFVFRASEGGQPRGQHPLSSPLGYSNNNDERPPDLLGPFTLAR